MEFTEPKPLRGTNGKIHKKRQTRNQTSVVYDKDLERLYSDPIWFYDEPPDFSISLYEFESYALDRLKLLRTIERINMTSTVKHSNEYALLLRKDLQKQNLSQFETLIYNSSISEELLAARKYDHISHYILRLAFCRTEDQRKWLIAMEMILFSIRLHIGSTSIFNFVIAKYKLPIEKVSQDEKEIFKDQLHNGTFHIESSSDITSVVFYKVAFAFALDLIKGRKVFLQAGYAFVPQTNVGSIIIAEFRSRFSKALSEIIRLTPLIEEDERLKYLLQDFDKKYTGIDYAFKKGNENCITVEKLCDLSKKSFPLCMKSLYDVVTTDYHLKHWGRLQLGLFFKGVGLPLEESIKYWRSNFTKKADIDANRFDKQYLYNIRHMYGQEGKRADYTSYNCMKVIMQNVGPGDSHGCPFRHSDEISLRTKLVAAEIPPVGIKEILELIEKHHYQVACQKYFEWTHNQATVEGGVMHPNQYFEESLRVLQGKQSLKAAVRIPTTKRMIYEDGSTQSSTQENDAMDSSCISTSIEKHEPMDDDDELDIDLLMSSMDT